MENFILNFLDSMGRMDFGFIWQIFFYALGIFWIVVLYWVWLDSGDRTSNKMTRILYVVLTLVLNVVGLIIYLIIRPSLTIEEIYWADLERRYLKYETAELGDCPKCGTQLYPGYTFCPNCRYKLKVKCQKCDVYIDRKNKFCPYCGTEALKRRFPEEIAPSKEVMEQQIKATKDEATEVVETNRTRYSRRGDITVKVGEAIVGGYKIIIANIEKSFSSVKELMKKKEKEVEKKGKKKKSRK